MATWTDLSAAFAYGTKLTSQQQQQLRDNIQAGLEGASGSPLAETAGDNDYFSSGDFGDNIKSTGLQTWQTLVSLRVVTGGTFRFYWGYRCDTDNETGYFRIQVDGVTELGPFSDTGTSGSDPYHYRTDDITLSSGEVVAFQAYVTSGGTSQLRVTLRGTNRTGIFYIDAAE
jgi:hypothetical protein